ncbi:MAG TPA: Na+/H+ antiporter [Casimicrobiaceae bacterium]|nr:Na+/H+ antiporter [Casimicrobiaceae bacterium]
MTPPAVTIELVLALLFALAVIAAIARWSAVPAPLAMIAGGVALSFVPGLERVHLDPAVFFLLFVPPLLYADGWLMPRREFVDVMRPVLLLAFGLVLATVVAVGYAMHALIPALPLVAAFALGAIVSPTDAVATASMTARLPLPGRVTHILNGESLINDASGLVAFKFAVAAAATGAFSLAAAGVELAWVAIGGVVAGLACAWAIGMVRVGLKRVCVDDPTIQTVLSLLSPFAAYLAAEHIGVSGILAIVAAGIYGGWHDARTLSPATRRHAWEVWAMVLFVFNGMVFLLLGVTLRPAIESLVRVESPSTLAGYAIALWVVVTLVRIAWVYPGTYLPVLLSRRVREREPPRDPRAVLLVGWAGLRGSVTMAAALSLPVATAAGAPFPGRDMVIFLAATTIVLTLLVNGLTLPVLVRALALRADGRAEREHRAAEIALAQAAALALEREAATLARGDEAAEARKLVAEYATRAARHTANADRRVELDRIAASRRRLLAIALDAERRELSSMLDAGLINDETHRAIEARIDHAEMLASEAPRAQPG